MKNKLFGRTNKITIPEPQDMQLCSNLSDYFSDKIIFIYDNLNPMKKQLPRSKSLMTLQF